MSTEYEDELVAELEGEIAAGLIDVVPDSCEYFKRLASVFPVSGSRIDWSSLPCGINHYCRTKNSAADEFLEFYERITHAYGLHGRVIYMGDGGIDGAFISQLGQVGKNMKLFLTVPQHHYFVGEDFSWCMFLSFEGEFGFGFNPRFRQTEKH
jgi:hypothetical protein